MIALLDCLTCDVALHHPSADAARQFIERHRAHALMSVTLTAKEATVEESEEVESEDLGAWEARLAATCPGCGQKSVQDGVCTLCGRQKTGGEVFVGKVAIR